MLENTSNEAKSNLIIDSLKTYKNNLIEKFKTSWYFKIQSISIILGILLTLINNDSGTMLISIGFFMYLIKVFKIFMKHTYTLPCLLIALLIGAYFLEKTSIISVNPDPNAVKALRSIIKIVLILVTVKWAIKSKVLSIAVFVGAVMILIFVVSNPFSVAIGMTATESDKIIIYPLLAMIASGFCYRYVARKQKAEDEARLESKRIDELAKNRRLMTEEIKEMLSNDVNKK